MVFQCEIFDISFSYEDEDIGRFSNLYKCTFNLQKFLFTFLSMTREIG